MPIYIATSHWFIAITIVLYLNIALAIWLTNWQWWWCAAIYSFMLFDVCKIIKSYGLRTHKYSVSWIMPDCDKWRYQLVSGKEYKGELIKSNCYRSSLLLILYIKGMTHRRYIVIPRDSLSCHNYRLLALRMQD